MPTSRRTAAPFLGGLLATFVAVAVPRAASAAPITYIEQISGDIDTAPPAFVLDTGLNTFTGTTFVNPDTEDIDFDNFGFTVPAGLEVDAARVVLTDVTGDPTQTTWNFNEGS